MSEHDGHYKVELDVFEGPLDLLLHLVKKHELDILDIPIGFVTDRYLEYLDAMQGLDLDTAGEYLVMAATLCHLKSRELLPSGDGAQHDEDEDEEHGEDGESLDPRADLIRRLLEYQKYKAAALHLGDRPVVGRNVWGRGTPTEDAVAENVDAGAVAPLAPFPVHKLIEAFDRILRRAKLKVTHDVLIDRLSVSQKIAELTDRLEAEGSFTFSSMFSFLREERAVSIEEIRHEAVVTFLALLEMAKLRLIAIQQAADVGEGGDDAGEIYIARATEDLRAKVASAVAGSDEYR
jgi:segregation and condensation protein A